MLHAGRTLGLESIEWRVVVGKTSGIGEVHPREILPHEGAEVGSVRQPLVDLLHQRAGHRVGRRLRKSLDQESVGSGRLEHDRGSRRAASLHVQHDRDFVEPRMLGNEGPRAEQSQFLAVREQNDDVVAQRRAELEDAHRLEDRRHSRAGVAGTVRGGHRVVVRYQSDCTGGIGTGYPRHDVVDLGGDVRVVRSRRDRMLHQGIDTESGEGAEQILAHVAMGTGTQRVRLSGDDLQMLARASRGELRRGRVQPFCRRRPERAQTHGSGHRKQQQQDDRRRSLRVDRCHPSHLRARPGSRPVGVNVNTPAEPRLATHACGSVGRPEARRPAVPVAGVGRGPAAP